jgi:predicted ATPase/DNA-binding winged helix-turn-helix (wHTH) protein
MAGTEGVYVFRSFRVDPARRLLLRGASPVRVTAKVFDLLMVLIRGRERVIPRDELIEQLWPDTSVEDGNLSVGISTLRKALGEGPADAPIIETSPRVGYRFVAEVHEEPAGIGQHARVPPAAARTESVVPLPGAASELPSEATPFIGRESELAELARLLLDPDVRLVSIVGPGGMGKSRFVLEAARRHCQRVGAFRGTALAVPELPREAVFVELGPLASAELVLSAIAEALGFQFYSGAEPKAQLLAYLKHKGGLLLVLDNFEHVLEAASLVGEILQAAVGLKVLTTSRERLGLSRESVFPLSGMTFPDMDAPRNASDFSGVKLFLESARRVKLDLEFSDAVAQQAARICRLVQGLPLGIVLAASWASVLTPAEIGDEIAESFEFLSTDFQDVPARQHSIRAVFDCSYKLLAPEERAVFARLALFRGGFSRAAAEQVAGADLRTLASLMNKSLVTRDATSGRYRVHELLRQYAESCLRALPGQSERTADAHASHYAAFLGERAPAFKGTDPQIPAAEIECEIDNVRAAWSRLLETRDLARTNAALETLRFFYALRSGFVEAEQAFRAAVTSFGEPEPERGSEHERILARALALQAHACEDQWHHERAISLAERALSLLDERAHPLEAAHALLIWAISSLSVGGNVQPAFEASERALALYSAFGDGWETAKALSLLGRCHPWLGPARAETCFRDSIELQRALPDRVVVMPECLTGLGDILAEQGKYAEGCQLMVEGLALIERRGRSWSTVLCLQTLASLERKRGNYTEAEAYAREGIALAREAFPFAETWAQVFLGDVLKERGLLADAEFHYRAAMESDSPLITAVAVMNLGDIALLRGELGEAELNLARSLADFERMQTRWGIIVCHDDLGYLACLNARYSDADAHFQRALEHALPCKLMPLALNVLAGIALSNARCGNLESAVELLSLVDAHAITERRTRARRVEPLLAELASILPASAFETAARRGRTLVLEDTLRAPSGANAARSTA